MTPMWKSLVAHVLLPVIDLRQPVSIVFVKSQKKATYPFELEMKLKDSLKEMITSVGKQGGHLVARHTLSNVLLKPLSRLAL